MFLWVYVYTIHIHIHTYIYKCITRIHIYTIICKSILIYEIIMRNYCTNSCIHGWTNKDIFFPQNPSKCFATSFHLTTGKRPYPLFIFKCGGRFCFGYCFVLHLFAGILIGNSFFLAFICLIFMN